MLILEGSDCLGKTTFARTLLGVADAREKFPTFYSHMSRPNSVFDFYTDYLDMMTRYAIQDRFHLGGIVWHNRICQPSLDIIEGWLKGMGSMTFIMFASDHAAYRDMIEKDERGNLLSIDAMVKANFQYEKLAHQGHALKAIVDFGWDISKKGYPTVELAEQVISEWFKRLILLEV